MTSKPGSTAVKMAALSALVIPLAVVLTGCGGECLDKYDCRKYDTKDQSFTCVMNKCEVEIKGGAGGGAGGSAGGDAGGSAGGAAGGSAGGAAGGSAGGTAGGSAGGAAGGSAGGAAGGSAGGAAGGTAGGAAGGTAGGAAGGTAGGAAGGTAGGAAGGSAGGAAGGTMTFAGTYVAALSGNQENPPVTTTATGSGTFTLSDPDGGSYSLTWNVTHDAALPNGAHIHTGWATQNGGVLQDLGASASPITGSAAVSDAVAQSIATGAAYVNVHTAAQATGELRGQILKQNQLLWTALLSGAESQPPVVGADAGSFGVIIDPATATATYQGFWPNTPATDGGIYQGGPLASGALVQSLDLTPGGAAGSFPIAGLGLGDGGFYVNVQTAANPSGEIRGQLSPKP